MEPVEGDLCEVELGALNGLFSIEEVHLMAQLFGNYPSSSSSSSLLSDEQEAGLAFLSNHEPSTNIIDVLGFDENVYDNSTSYHVLPSQESCFLDNYHNLSNYDNVANFLVNDSNINSMSKDSCVVVNEQSNSLSGEVLLNKLSNGGGGSGIVRESGEAIASNDVSPDQKFQAKRKIGMTQEDSSAEGQSKTIRLENQNKKSRVSRTAQGYKKNGVTKKSQTAIANVNSDEKEETNADLIRQSCSNDSSEDDTNASQEMNGGAETSSSSKESEVPNLSRRTRARRGSATDPQSLYARKRRERINERLRILQNLVPNGTKVDISTMLEEAVQYVKFLQLQIKLLSSDDLWMYAPIAYNGMNIGLDLKISPPSL